MQRRWTLFSVSSCFQHYSCHLRTCTVCVVSLSLRLLLFLFPSSCLHPLSIIHSSSQVVFIERLRMHQLLSAGLWPTPVSVLARFVQPLLFHLFSFHLLHFLPVDTVVCPYISFWDGETVGLWMHTPNLFFLFLFFYLTLSRACLCCLPFIYHSASTPDSSFPFLLTTCFNMSVVFLAQSDTLDCFILGLLIHPLVNVS